MTFNVIIQPEAFEDIQEGVDYYNSKQDALGSRFHAEVLKNIQSIRENPFYQTRYDAIHCKPLKIFPYMIHFSIEEAYKVINVFAVICCYQNPEEHWVGKR